MNTYFRPQQPQMFVKPILSSRSVVTGQILHTIHVRTPRIIWAEWMTHRAFSRNARSSRAVPIEKMIEEVRTIPFVPWHWGKNQKGMQASEECNETVWNQLVQMPISGGPYGHPLDWKGAIQETTGVDREDAWLMAAERAIQSAEAFMKAGYHKQLVNRLLEPFMWIDGLITSTEWNNFAALRDHEAAEPHFRDHAGLVAEALKNAVVQDLEPGEWHLPYITQEDWVRARVYDSPLEFLRKISAARCARISYAPFDGDASFKAEIARYDSLMANPPVHASPVEHQATPDTMSEYNLTMIWDGDKEELIDSGMMFDHPKQHGNLPGWIQFRKTIPGEYVRG